MSKQKKKILPLVESVAHDPEYAKSLIRQRHSHYTKQKIETVFCFDPDTKVLSCFKKEGAPTKNRVPEKDMADILAGPPKNGDAKK